MDTKVSETSSTVAIRERSRATAALIEAEEELLEARTQVEIKVKYCNEMMKRLRDANAAVESATIKAASAVKQVDRALAERSVAETYEKKARKNKQEAQMRLAAAERLLNVARRRLRAAEDTENKAQRARSTEGNSLTYKPSLTRSWPSGKKVSEYQSNSDVATEEATISRSISLPAVIKEIKEGDPRLLQVTAAVESVLSERGVKLDFLTFPRNSQQTRLGRPGNENRQAVGKPQIARIASTPEPPVSGPSQPHCPHHSTKPKYHHKTHKRVRTPPSRASHTGSSTCGVVAKSESDGSSGGNKEATQAAVPEILVESKKSSQEKTAEVVQSTEPLCPAVIRSKESRSVSRQSFMTVSLKHPPREWQDDSFVLDEGLVPSPLPVVTVIPPTDESSKRLEQNETCINGTKSVAKKSVSSPSLPGPKSVTSETELFKKAALFDISKSTSTLGIAKMLSSSARKPSESSVERYNAFSDKNQNKRLSFSLSDQRSITKNTAKVVTSKACKVLAALDTELAVPPPVVKWTDFIPPKRCKSGDGRSGLSQTQLVLTTSIQHDAHLFPVATEKESDLASLGVNAKGLSEFEIGFNKTDSLSSPVKTESLSNVIFLPVKKEPKIGDKFYEKPDLKAIPIPSKCTSNSGSMSDKPEDDLSHPHFMKQVKFSDYLHFAQLSPDLASYRSDGSDAFQTRDVLDGEKSIISDTTNMMRSNLDNVAIAAQSPNVFRKGSLDSIEAHCDLTQSPSYSDNTVQTLSLQTLVGTGSSKRHQINPDTNQEDEQNCPEETQTQAGNNTRGNKEKSVVEAAAVSGKSLPNTVGRTGSTVQVDRKHNIRPNTTKFGSRCAIHRYFVAKENLLHAKILSKKRAVSPHSRTVGLAGQPIDNAKGARTNLLNLSEKRVTEEKASGRDHPTPSRERLHGPRTRYHSSRTRLTPKTSQAKIKKATRRSGSS